LNKITEEAVIPRGYILFERPYMVTSDNLSRGMVTVDVLCYLKSWAELAPKDIKIDNQQMKLFSFSISDINQRKITRINDILKKIKNIKTIK